MYDMIRATKLVKGLRQGEALLVLRVDWSDRGVCSISKPCLIEL